jgi:hypothetical protein
MKTATTHIEIITPDIAKMYLTKNTRNRPLNKNRVKTFADAIKRGEWKLNGETIKMNDDVLIDGQTRLHAIIAAGVPIQTYVIKGLDSDVFDSIDIGGTRTSPDIFALMGENYCSKMSSALIMVNKYLTGRVAGSNGYTLQQMRQLLEEHPDIRISCREVKDTKKIISPSLLTACHYIFSKLDREMADKFVHRLITGAGLEEGDPIYLLRERLINNTLSKAKLNREYLMAIVIKSWNAVRSNTTIKHLRYMENESFPIIS